MSDSWDSFEPFLILEKRDFVFHSVRYETWMDRNIVDSGSANTKVTASIIYEGGAERVLIQIDNAVLFDEILPEIIFDEFITANDRLQLITIPQVSNGENTAISLFKMVIGSTRDQKNFKQKEPYCCNLFLKNGIIEKITFSFSFPDKLLELY